MAGELACIPHVRNMFHCTTTIWGGHSVSTWIQSTQNRSRTRKLGAYPLASLHSQPDTGRHQQNDPPTLVQPCDDLKACSTVCPFVVSCFYPSTSTNDLSILGRGQHGYLCGKVFCVANTKFRPSVFCLAYFRHKWHWFRWLDSIY